eukprot:CAMPEP_0172446196 /NCGR_PEP_ID=MMETSP1065-20121228/5852_1 /TAXON_ID=265537 /ORGANISM="Amphiprora paludosa, Strain CCMP125" /LENGTH=351 /DNA_ID=CAMNT_0013197255 /DNA_START=101 /DNA_END=1156 /DNA_ORIENTATION=+
MTPAVRTALDEVSKTGEFKRVEAGYRNWIKNDPSAEFPAEKDRYHLYVSYACPWACRTLMTRSMKGLQDVITVTVVHPVWQKTKPGTDEHAGWMFGTSETDAKHGAWSNHAGNGGPFSTHFPDTEADPFTGSKSVREVYDSVQDTGGKYTVPVLYDKKTKQIVSNESSEIIRMLSSEFNEFAKNPDFDIYPEDMREAIDGANEWIYPAINNGVYRCGFATTQAAYDKAIGELTDAFDRLDSVLQKQRFVAGDKLTEADIRLFVTLVRFDEVYIVYFKTNTRSVMHTPSILNYCREVYQTPGVKETVNMEHIKTHYFCSHPTLNHYSIIPKGSGFLEALEEPHNREELFPSK